MEEFLMSSVLPPFGGPSAQLCLRCGTPLPSNAVTCLNCGTYNPVAYPGTFSDQRGVQWGGLQSQPSLSSGQYSGNPPGQPSVYPSQFNHWAPSSSLPQNNVYGASPSSNSYYPMPGQSPQLNSNNFYVASQQNAYYSPPMNTYGGYIQSSQQKSGPRVGFIVGIILLVVLIVGGAFAGYYYYKHHYQNSTSSKNSPSVLVTPTAVPLFRDTLFSNNMGWDLTSSQGKFSVKVGDGSLVLEDDQNKLLWEVVPGKIFTDFRLDVNATLTRGDPNNGYGVLIRASSQGTDLGSYYRFELYGDGTYAIFKGYLDATGTTQSIKIQGYLAHPAIAKVGQVNHLTIVAKGPAMSLIVNGQTVSTYTDDNYKGGSIALFVSNLPELTPGAQATFTNLAVFPVPK
jgi:hypothetical protein